MPKPRLTPDDVARSVSTKLAEAFDAIAKEAMQAAAMAHDPSVVWPDKLDKAHAHVALITEAAMRGLKRASRIAVVGIVRVLTEEDERGGELTGAAATPDLAYCFLPPTRVRRRDLSGETETK